LSRRPDWDTYFFRVAAEVATRATCPRAQIGAVLVRDKRILSTGYNGPAAGAPHCPEDAAHMAMAHCLASLHAERNALANATVQTFGATMYVVGPRPICPACRDALSLCGVDYRWREAAPSLDILAREIRAWGAATFPSSNPYSTAEHLRREIEELLANPHNGEEQADVFHLLIQLARTTEVDLVAEVARKFAVNRRRAWQAPDEFGVVEHVREEVPS
jgi:pyrimidine deaminase RibD-like protein